MPRLHSNDLLRQGQGKGHLQDLTVGEALEAGQGAQAPSQRAVALPMPADEQLGLLAVGFEVVHGQTPAEIISGRAWPFRRMPMRPTGTQES